MSQPSLKQTLSDAMKAAMRAKDKERLSAVRLILSEIKRIEVDERIEIDDARCLAVLDKMCKQRRDSISQYEGAGREDLASVERQEMEVIQSFMPNPLSADELDQLISQAIADTGADSIKAMGQVVAQLKPAVQGRADMGEVSRLIKARLG
ncbi:GatB/YqeY domain-containing protein [Spongiibacter sp. KMU-166]|uniref:GatB/YqeY domain-containing protein n=1 Tax=Spongiibacter thalassae TaxID=2721624 RepID=A0ABX1GCD3_9GAMM|nr:GatB/YqeY domain-containing protein [Spongiibacter thalassae]NKI16616.1 GatB/YqeY domain-containing protein [Spongiibacter thalassae]